MKIIFLFVISLAIFGTSSKAQTKGTQTPNHKISVPQTKKSSKRLQKNKKSESIKNEIRLIQDAKSLSEQQKKQKIKSFIQQKKLKGGKPTPISH
jgi:hypothetical protein